jgi:hypothetical protein
LPPETHDFVKDAVRRFELRHERKLEG